MRAKTRGRPIGLTGLLGAASAGALIALLAGHSPLAGAAKHEPRAVTPRGPLLAEEQATIRLFETTRDSVVFISTSSLVRDFWSRDVFAVPRGSGSGFFWDEAGHLVTNYHVIEGASKATARLADGRDLPAELVGASPLHDLAVLRIKLNRDAPTPVPLGSSHDLRVGQKVLAIGNPFGLDWTLTTGIISALDRSLSGKGSGPAIEHLIQTDAAINPGNSGGPLLDSAGRLIGVNTAIYSPSGASAGIGFAVPVDTVNRVVPQLIAYGKYRRPTLGIHSDDALSQRIGAALEVKGVAVLRVAPGSGADKAGLRGATVTNGRIQPGDVITAVGGKAVNSLQQLAARLDDYASGQSVETEIWRKGKRFKTTIKLSAEE